MSVREKLNEMSKEDIKSDLEGNPDDLEGSTSPQDNGIDSDDVDEPDKSATPDTSDKDVDVEDVITAADLGISDEPEKTPESEPADIIAPGEIPIDRKIKFKRKFKGDDGTDQEEEVEATLGELQSGYMKDADYRQKTTKLSEKERQTREFLNDPRLVYKFYADQGIDLAKYGQPVPDKEAISQELESSPPFNKEDLTEAERFLLDQNKKLMSQISKIDGKHKDFESLIKDSRAEKEAGIIKEAWINRPEEYGIPDEASHVYVALIGQGKQAFKGAYGSQNALADLKYFLDEILSPESIKKYLDKKPELKDEIIQSYNDNEAKAKMDIADKTSIPDRGAKKVSHQPKMKLRNPKNLDEVREVLERIAEE